MTTSKRILFVDDDASVLASLESLLRKDRARWDMVFALGGQRGLEEVRKAPFAVVVADLGMPGIDGATMLNVIRKECPATVRIMLSGHADQASIMRLLPAAHQLLTKPCNAATLRGVIERSFGTINVDRDTKILRVIGGVDKLPTPPDVFFELSRLIQSSSASVSDVARVVTRDLALSAKLLQIVNSPHFGASQVSMSVHQAVGLLGTEQLRCIALTAWLFATPKSATAPMAFLEDIQKSSMRAAMLARTFAAPEHRDDAFTSTLLHHVGHVVLALCRGTELPVFSKRVELGERALDVELDLFGVTHADVGARLLAIWGLPMPIVDVAQFHHDPGSAPESSRRLASIVHVADAIVREPACPDLDLPSLERAGCAELIAGWRATAARCDGPV